MGFLSLMARTGTCAGTCADSECVTHNRKAVDESDYAYPKQHDKRGIDPKGYAQDFDSCTAVAVLRMAFYGALRPESESFLACAAKKKKLGAARTRRRMPLPSSNLVGVCHPSVV